MTVIIETRLFQVVLGAGFYVLSSRTVKSIEKHMPPHNPLGKLLYLVIGAGVRIVVIGMISIKIRGTNRVISRDSEGPPVVIEPREIAMFEGEVIRATFMPH